MDYDTYHTDFYSTLRQEVVDAGITLDGNQVDILASYNDENDSPPVIALSPIEPSEEESRFGDTNKGTNTIMLTQVCQVVADTTKGLDELTQKFTSALPRTVEGFERKAVDISYDFRSPNQQKIHSNTISLTYKYR